MENIKEEKLYELVFDLSKENIIYNSDGFIYNYYYKEKTSSNDKEYSSNNKSNGKEPE